MATVYRVLLPGAKNGLLSAVLLGMGRVVGETMAVLMATGNADNNPFSSDAPFLDLLVSVKTMTATIAKEMGDTAIAATTIRCCSCYGFCFFPSRLLSTSPHIW